MLKPISIKIEEKQLKLLDALSRETHIPKSALIRDGIELVIRHHKEDVVSPDLQKEIAAMLKEDQTLLDKLAKA